MRIIFFGDVVGKPGRQAVAKILPRLRQELKPDLVIANVENLAHGKGVTIHTLNALLEAGVQFFTSGNHVFDKMEEAKAVFAQYPEKIIRPANFSPFGGSPEGRPDNLPGKGYAILEIKNHSVLMINLNGRVFMEKQFDFGEITNPFEALSQVLDQEKHQTKIRVLDFHAEATSEKKGMGFWADGKISAMVGTHTHVPTADAQILPQGTGYLTDLGMAGAARSVIGVETAGAVKRLIAEEKGNKTPTQIPETNQYEIGYAIMEIDEQTGKCQNITGHLSFLNGDPDQN